MRGLDAADQLGYQCSQAFPIAVPGGPGGPLVGHTLQFVGCLISQGTQCVSITQGDLIVLV